MKYLKRIQNLWRLGGAGLVLAVVMAKISRGTRLVKLRVPGAKFSVQIRYPSSDLDTFYKVLVMREYQLSLTHAPGFIIDGGANIGLSAVYFAMQFPQATIVAVEPEHENFQLLLRNTANFPNIRPVHAALWSAAGLIHLDDPGMGEWAYTVGDFIVGDSMHPTRACKEMTSAVNVELLLRESKATVIDVLKLDVEGAEKELFTHCEGWIHAVRTVVLELHDRWTPGCTQAFQQATSDFPIKWENGENTFAGRDGWLKAPDGAGEAVMK